MLRRTVALPLSAGKMVIESSFLRFCRAWNSPLLMWLAGGLDFFTHLVTSALRLWAFAADRWQQASSVLTITSLTGKPLGTMAKSRPFSSTERSSDVRTCSDLLITHLALSGVVSAWSFCVVLACLASTSFENFVWCLHFVSAKTRPCLCSRKAVTSRDRGGLA